MLQTALMRTRLEVRDARLCAIVFCRSSLFRSRASQAGVVLDLPVQIPCGENGEMWTIVKPRIKITGSGDGTVLYPTHRLTNDSRTKTEPRNATG